MQKNAEAWRSFDRLDDDPEYDPSPPGYWGNRSDGYELKSVVRNDLYRIDWNADQSTIELPVDKALNNKYDIPGRGYLVELELRGHPRWKAKNCRLDVSFDESSQYIRVNHPMTVQPDFEELRRRDDFSTTLTTENTDTTDARSAAIDVGANNTLSIVTSDGDALVFNAPRSSTNSKRVMSAF